MKYAQGTRLDTHNPYGFFCGGRALCPDGRVRTLKRIAQMGDTYFSIPASVTFKGRTVSGYVTVVEVNDPSDIDAEDVVEFWPYLYGKNAHLFTDDAEVM